MKKTTLIALGLAIVLLASFAMFDADYVSAHSNSAGADCDCDGTVDLVCTGGSKCSGTDELGCACMAADGSLVVAKQCPQQ